MLTATDDDMARILQSLLFALVSLNLLTVTL